MYELTTYIRRLDKSREGLMYLKSLLGHKRSMLYFTQPSTRTFLSFHSACHILGMSSSEIRDSATSSERKGESIDDSLRTFASYVDIIIMRTAVPGLCDRIANLLDETPRPIPVINAGSGPDQHPTQALLDIYTLNRSFREMGGIDGKTIMMVGDLKRGRTIRSLSLLMRYYKDVNVIFSSPPEYKIDEPLRQKLKGAGIRFEETAEFVDPLKTADAVYMTRVQDEYDIAGESKPSDYNKYHLKASHLDIMKKTAVIMHPMPRRNELDVAIDADPRAKYWRQERNGMWTRVALMTMVLGADKNILIPDL
jgi:aspartate carbamoyltransferase catalytic subunit